MQCAIEPYLSIIFGTYGKGLFLRSWICCLVQTFWVEKLWNEIGSKIEIEAKIILVCKKKLLSLLRRIWRNKLSYFLRQWRRNYRNFEWTIHKNWSVLSFVFDKAKLGRANWPHWNRRPFSLHIIDNSIYLWTNGLQEAQYCPFMPNWVLCALFFRPTMQH